MKKNIRKSSREIEREKFRLVINERKKRGLGELKLTPHLIHAAREHSKDMIRRHFFSLNWKGSIHRSPFHLTNKGSIHR